MSVTDNTNKHSVFTESADQWHLLFAQLEPQHVEAFYQHYQQWQKQQRVMALGEQITAIEQHIIDNAALMQIAQPSPIALATLTRLQSSGVEDVDLLDTLLERGDTWLDHTMQLLERCEELDLIHDNYTEWCRLALEGAYDWLDSVKETAPVTQQPSDIKVPEALHGDITESLLLEKLMSEDETVKISAIIPTSKSAQSSHSEEILSTHVATPSAIAIPVRLSYGTRLTKTAVIDTQVSITPAIALPTRLSYTMQIVAPALIIAEPVGEHGEEQPAQLLDALPEDTVSPIEEQPAQLFDVLPQEIIPPIEEQPQPPLAVPPIEEQRVPTPLEKQQKSPKRGLISRILAKVWQT